MFKKLMKEKGVTQCVLAQKLGVHQTLISQWCHGKSKPSIYQVPKIAETMGVTSDEVIRCFSKKKYRLTQKVCDQTASSLCYHNTNLFDNYKEIKGARIDSTILTDDTISALKGLETIGSIKVPSLSMSCDSDEGADWMTLAVNATFVEVGGYTGVRFYPIWAHGKRDLFPEEFKNFVAYTDVEYDTATFNVPQNGMEGNPIGGTFKLTFYR